MNQDPARTIGAPRDVDDLRPEDLDACFVVWRQGYLAEAERSPGLPRGWADDREAHRAALASRIQAGRAVAARRGGELAGYLAYDAFPFHGDACAFSPVMAHGASGPGRIAAYEAMYRELSHRWVGRGQLTHLVTFWAHDVELRELLFRLGFGLYVVDAFRPAGSLDAEVPPDLELRRADAGDAHALERLVEESRLYYAQAPLFLMREPRDLPAVRELLEDEQVAVFLASWGEVPVGFMDVRLSERDDPLTLCRRDTATLDPLGAFVRPFWRAGGVGKALLGRCLEWARERGAAQTHVDFESANPLGGRFWPRHFTETLLSLKRSVFHDALEGRRTVTVVEHDPAWRAQFEAEAAALRGALGPCLVALHHIGSTSVPGLPAKPILDILAEARSLEEVDRLGGAMEALGYRVMGEHGIPGRRYYQKGHPQHTHHVHLYRAGDPNLRRHLAFRDYLRAHPARAGEYGELKRSLAARDPYDVDGYQRGKSALASALEREALAWSEA